jgi:predicted acyltransferase
MIDRGGFTTEVVGALRRHALKIGYALVLAGYALALLYFLPPRVLLSRQPVSGQELDTHVVQTFRVVEALERHGKSWAYDPQLLAGCPQGVIFDADNKAWEL